jgi:hypothetical protein
MKKIDNAAGGQITATNSVIDCSEVAVDVPQSNLILPVQL